MDFTETLRVVHFDDRKHVLAVHMYRGQRTQVVLPLRIIIADALRLGSTGLLLSHNHPSGDPTPSFEDINATHRLARAAIALGIRLHDHLIIGTNQQVSFRKSGLL